MTDDDFRQDIIAGLTAEEQSQLDGFVDPDEPQDTPTYLEGREAELLGGMLHDKEFRLKALPKIKPNYFLLETHKAIAKIIIDLHDKYGDVSKEWVARELEKQIEDKKPAIKMEYLGALAELTDYYTAASTHTRQYWVDYVTKFHRNSEFKIMMRDVFKDQKEKGDVNLSAIGDAVRRLAKATNTNPLSSMTLAELTDYAAENKTDWIMDGWLPRGQVVIFSAPPKAGKSTTVFTLAAGLQTGKWLNKMDVKKCPVLYVDLENPPEYITGNFAQYLRNPSQAKIRCLHPENRPTVIDGNWLESYIEASGFEEKGVVVIDSATIAFGALFGDNPNWDNQAACVRNAVDPINAVARRTGWSVIIIHHDNKSGGIRGSADWAGAVDLIWRLSPDGDKRTMTVRGRLLEQPPALILTKVGTRLELLGTKHETQEAEIQSDIKKLLAAIPALSSTEATPDTSITVAQLIDLKLPVGQKKLRRLLADLHKDGKVSCSKFGGSANTPDYYWREKLLL